MVHFECGVGDGGTRCKMVSFWNMLSFLNTGNAQRHLEMGVCS